MEECEPRKSRGRGRLRAYAVTVIGMVLILLTGWQCSDVRSPFTYVRRLTGKAGGWALKHFVHEGMTRNDCERILGEPDKYWFRPGLPYTTGVMAGGDQSDDLRKRRSLLDYPPPIEHAEYTEFGFSLVFDPVTKRVLGIVE